MSCFSSLFNRSINSNPFDDPPVSKDSEKHSTRFNFKVESDELRETSEKKVESKVKVELLREKLIEEGLDAYVIPTNDAHSSEYVGSIDARRAWISGFNGSAGVAIVTLSTAIMFVDSRYYTQAEQQLDSKVWELQKVGLKDILNWDKWLATMPERSRIGLDPYLTSFISIISLRVALEPFSISLVFPEKNLVDLIWDNQPKRQHEPVILHGLEFAGESSLSKLNALKNCLTLIPGTKSRSVNDQPPSFLVTSLPSIAWLLNLRGSDIEFNPLFYSYVLVTPSSSFSPPSTSPFPSNITVSPGNRSEKIEEDSNGSEVILFLQSNVLTLEARQRLEVDGVEIREYEEIQSALEERKGSDRKILSGSTISYGLALAMGADNLRIVRSPIEDAQAIKNAVELEGFRKAYLRDGLAWVKWAAWVEESIVKGKKEINEWDAAVELTRFRENGEFYRGLSYENISATNENAALPHYAPSSTKSRIIDTKTPYLNDSGAQYLDGTIDTTRTVHFGTPAPHQRLAFTRVLQGHIAIDACVFPRGTTGYQLDLLARGNLWKEGMDYAHGTGHGVGEYLPVHEGPQGIGSSLVYNATPFLPGHITSNEPGYYKVGHFGIRLESVVAVKEVKTKYNEGDKGWLGFERFTMVPIQTSFTDSKLMSRVEKEWLKEHNKKCVQHLSPFLAKDHRTLKWLKKQ